MTAQHSPSRPESTPDIEPPGDDSPDRESSASGGEAGSGGETPNAAAAEAAPSGAPRSDVTGSEAKPGTSQFTPAVGAWWTLALCLSAVIASAFQIVLRATDQGFFIITLCFVICIAAAALDVATRRIPNVLTYPAILLGLGLNAILPPILEAAGLNVAALWLGASGLRDGLMGFGLCAVIGIVSFIARGLGGGDVKLLAAVGALLGLSAVIPVLFNTLVFAALIGVLNWVARGEIVSRMQLIATGMLTAIATRRHMENIYPFGRSEAPFGLALLLGLILAQFIALHEVVLAIGW